MPEDLAAVCSHFQLLGAFLKGGDYGTGHINDTYAVEYDQAGLPARYILQRLNTDVFTRPRELMENVDRVTRHLSQTLADEKAPDAGRRALTIVPTREGASYYEDAEGNFWRVYLFIEHARTFDELNAADQAIQAAKAFGTFQKQLTTLPGERLNETITDFHNTRWRFGCLQEAIEKDTHNRAAGVKDEIEFALSREKDVGVLLDLQAAGEIPERVTHNDTKINNVMIDDKTPEAICVIDLDTVMPGLVLYDFGDMVRTVTTSVAEDEPDTDKLKFRMNMFEALAQGYLSTAGDFLNAKEREMLPFSGKLMTMECGFRFLADHLMGDVYFKTHRDGHNVDRCRTQFKLVREIDAHEDQLNKYVASL